MKRIAPHRFRRLVLSVALIALALGASNWSSGLGL